MLVQVHGQLLGVRLLSEPDHLLELDITGHDLQGLRVGLQRRGGVLPELEECLPQLVRPPGIPVQGGPGALPLVLYGGVVQEAAEDQIGQGLVPVEQGHDGLADARVAAVELEAPGGGVAFHLPGVAGHAAAVALGGGVDGPAEGGMALKEVDVPALGVQNVGRDAGEHVEVGDQLEQLLLVKENIHKERLRTRGIFPRPARRLSPQALSPPWGTGNGSTPVS